MSNGNIYTLGNLHFKGTDIRADAPIGSHYDIQGIHWRDSDTTTANYTASIRHAHLTDNTHGLQFRIHNDAGTSRMFKWYIPATSSNNLVDPYIQWDAGRINNTILPNITNTYELGSTDLSWKNLYIGKANGSGIYYVGTHASQQMIRFIDGTDANGNGISIGGGGLTVLGAGESTNTILTNLSLTSAGGTEQTYITSDQEITFYTKQQDGYNAGYKILMQYNRVWAGVNGNTASEAQVGVQSGAGQMYLYSGAAADGKRGLYITKHGTGSARSIIEVNTNDNITLRGHDVWGSKLRVTSNWLGFYADDFTATTRYGYIQCNVDQMIFRKENSSTQDNYFNFGSRIYTPSISVGYTNTSYALSANTAIINSWIRTKGSTGWYNQDYEGGWYMADANWIRSYNSKPVLISIGTNNAYGISGHRLALGLEGSSHVSLMMRGGDVMYGFCVNNNGNWYFGKRTSKSMTSTTGDSYIYYGHDTLIAPSVDNSVALGGSSNRWKECRAVNFYGALTGNVTGNCSGSAGSLSGGLTTNDVTTHGNLKVTTLKGSYYGINLGGNAGGMTIMSKNASSQGLYNQTNGQWILYYDAASTSKSICIGGSTITVTGGISLYKNTKVTGTLEVTSTITGTLSGTATYANYLNIVATNEIRFGGKPSSAKTLIYAHKWADGTSSALINGHEFRNGNGALADIKGAKVYNAVWNDFAEYRESDITEPGRVLISNGKGQMILCNKRLVAGAKVISDTFGCSVGQSDKAKTPLGVAGRVLVYTYQNRNNFKVGDAVCAAPNGTVDIMTREEIINYPDRIIGIVDEIPEYEIWDSVLTNKNEATGEIGGQNHTSIPVNGRIWIYVR